MNNIIKTLLNWRPSKRLTAIGFMALLAIAVFPILRLCLYTAPFYDDFSYGKAIRDVVQNGGGLWDMILAACENARISWYSWQGTFASIFLMSFMPAAFGEPFYFIGPVFLLFIYLVGIFVLVKVVARDIFGADWEDTVSLQAGTAFLLLCFFYEPQQGFYWYNGGIHYIGGAAFLMLFTAFLGKLLFTEQKKRAYTILLCVVSTLFAVLVSGSNYVATLQSGVILFGLILLAAIVYRKKALWSIPVAVVYLIGFYYNIIAPGNNVRQEHFMGVDMEPLEAILASFRDAVLFLPRMMGLETILIMAVLCPIFWRIVKKSKIRFRYPLLVVAVSICLYATGYTPELFATGRVDLGRVINVIKIMFQFLLLFNELYLVGYLYQKLGDKAKWNGSIQWWWYPIAVLAMTVIVYINPNPVGYFQPYGAYFYIHSGEAAAYRDQYLQRVDTILNSEEDDLELDGFYFRPWYLCSKEEISEDPEFEINRFIAAYYGKNSIRLRPYMEE